MKQQSAKMPHQAGQATHEGLAKKSPAPPLPTVGPPLDGRQYQNIVEEQKFSGQRPTREEQSPRHANQDKKR